MCVGDQMVEVTNVCKSYGRKNILNGVSFTASPGQQIAASGNTGKSTAPHLHYQINVGNKGKVVDPMKYHKTIIEKLPENERENFKNRISELDDLMKQ